MSSRCYTCYDDGSVSSINDNFGDRRELNKDTEELQNFLLNNPECVPAGFKDIRDKLLPKVGNAKPIACAERFKTENKPNQTLQWVNFSVTIFFAAVVTWFLFRSTR